MCPRYWFSAACFEEAVKVPAIARPRGRAPVLVASSLSVVRQHCRGQSMHWQVKQRLFQGLFAFARLPVIRKPWWGLKGFLYCYHS